MLRNHQKSTLKISWYSYTSQTNGLQFLEKLWVGTCLALEFYAFFFSFLVSKLPDPKSFQDGDYFLAQRKRGEEKVFSHMQLICWGSCVLSFKSWKEPMFDIKDAASTHTWAVWLGQDPSAVEQQWCHSYTHSPTLQWKPSGCHTLVRSLVLLLWSLFGL